MIDRDQIFVSVVDRGPDGVQLSSAFDRRFVLLSPLHLHVTSAATWMDCFFSRSRFVPENMASLGNTVGEQLGQLRFIVVDGFRPAFI